MFAIITTVEVAPDSIDELATLFDETNRELVAGHDDWLAAYFTANRDTNEVTVIAHWRRAESYQELRNSPEFTTIMAGFAERFVGPPRISVNQILVQM